MSHQSTKQNIIKCHKISEKLEEELKRQPLPEEIATEMQVEVNKVIEWLQLTVIDDNYENPYHELKFKLTIKNNELEKIRLRMGYTIKQMEEKIGRRSNYYSQVESCKRYPNHYVQKIIAETFNETTSRLFPKSLETFAEDWKKKDNIKIIQLNQISIFSPEVLQLTSGDYENMIETTNTRQLINKFTDKLTPKEKRFLEIRYGLKDNIPKTLEEVGDLYGVTRERIRQIEAKILEKIRIKNNITNKTKQYSYE